MSISLDDIIITDELAKRPRCVVDVRGENKLLHSLARSLGKPTPRLLGSFVEDALRLTGAGSAGVSLLEKDDSGKDVFRWVALAGVYKNFVGGITPRDFSPCGSCLARKSPQLYARPARYFDYFAKVQPPIIEGLVVPIWAAGVAVGTIWVVTHDLSRRFNLEDVRVLSSIAGFLGSVLAFTEASARSRALSACSPLGIFETDKLGLIVYVNQQFQAISGFKPKQVAGKNWSFLLRAPDKLKIFADWRRKTKKGAGYCEEVAFEAPSGKIRWVCLRSAPLRYDGILKGCVNSVEEISERRERNQLLRESEQFKTRILSSSPDCIKVLDAEGRLIFMNTHGQKIMEIENIEPLIHRKWTSFWPGRYRLKARQALAAARAGREGKFQGRARTLKGTLKWWDVIVTALRSEKGQIESYLSISRDITEEKAAEKALQKAQAETERYARELEARVTQRTQQIQKVNTKLRKLAGSLIHAHEEERRKLAHQLHDEISQELTGLKLLLEHSSGKVRTALPKINKEASVVLSKLITHVAHLAQNLRPAILERRGLVAALHWLAAEIEKRFQVKVACICSSTCEQVLTAPQKVEIFRIVQEALTNSARHSGTKTASITLQVNGPSLKVAIRDRGQGLDLRKAEKKASLGLLGIRERVSRLRGEINIASVPGRGTTINLWIPLAAKHFKERRT